MESRKHTRLIARDDSFVELKGDGVRGGMILDISPGGLSFSYLPEETPIDGFKYVEIYQAKNQFRLSDVPCAIVYDTFDSATGPQGDTCRRCGLRFGQMKDEHKNKLKLFFEQFYHRVEKRLAVTDEYSE